MQQSISSMAEAKKPETTKRKTGSKLETRMDALHELVKELVADNLESDKQIKQMQEKLDANEVKLNENEVELNKTKLELENLKELTSAKPTARNNKKYRRTD